MWPKTLAIALLLSKYSVVGLAADWTYRWTPAPNDSAPTVEICPLKYAKDWAYTLEIDDCPISTLTVAQPLLAKEHFTNAPPGIPGGQPLPFVGGSAVMVTRLGGNDTFLALDDLKKLQTLGWGLINHSYYHAGRTWGNPPEILTPEQFAKDLFWSQTILATCSPSGRAPTHFVYPNGYTAYDKYLPDFGLHTASRIAGASNGNAYDPKFNFLDIDRSYLDENAWTSGGKADVMQSFPATGPVPGQVFIDFTHGIDPKPDSANQQRWAQRLHNIATTYGQAGKDNVWSAPTGEIYDYVGACKKAKTRVESGKLTVELPDSLPGSPLTLKIQGISPDTKLTAPEGGLIYRSGTTVWITTPCIGKPGSPPPAPFAQCSYAGIPKAMEFNPPVNIAAVRLLQFGDVAPAYELKIDLLTPAGDHQALVPPDQTKPGSAWGVWHLYSTIPNGKAVTARGLELSPDPAFKKMEVWIVR